MVLFVLVPPVTNLDRLLLQVSWLVWYQNDIGLILVNPSSVFKYKQLIIMPSFNVYWLCKVFKCTVTNIKPWWNHLKHSTCEERRRGDEWRTCGSEGGRTSEHERHRVVSNVFGRDETCPFVSVLATAPHCHLQVCRTTAFFFNVLMSLFIFFPPHLGLKMDEINDVWQVWVTCSQIC